MKAFIDRIAGPAGPSDTEVLVEEGNRLLAAKDVAGAAEHFAAALVRRSDARPGDRRARRPATSPPATSMPPARRWPTLPASAAADPTVAAVRARIDLAAQTAALGDPAALEARLAADPKDHQARFDLALIQNAKGDREAATRPPP